jgi:hypothetical protein
LAIEDCFEEDALGMFRAKCLPNRNSIGTVRGDNLCNGKFWINERKKFVCCGRYGTTVPAKMFAMVDYRIFQLNQAPE